MYIILHVQYSFSITYTIYNIHTYTYFCTSLLFKYIFILCTYYNTYYFIIDLHKIYLIVDSEIELLES